ncbi:hypothetical protein [Geodermatophilus ruber]|uniref:hypothetical protein n=1 Tax=Geodermatophilus ruber TaxID=504800 RepID=UPI0011607DAE|nr:hypothetical protein [Geodermatophilus ruber]
MRVLSRCIAGSLLAVVVAGCGTAVTGQHTPGGGSPATPAPSSSGPAVEPEAACPVQTPEHLSGGGADATEVYICTRESRAVPDDGMWMFQVVRRVSGGLDPLLQAYAAPDDSPVSGIACAAIGYDPLVVYLHGDGGTRAVRAPVDTCGAPTAQARSAYDSLVTTVVRERSDARIQSQLSVDTQCPDAFKDILSLDERDRLSGADDGLAPEPLSDPVSVCEYRITTDADGNRIGHLDGHRILSGDRLRALNTALGHVRHDPSCSRHEQTSFAVLNMGGSQETVVALDGCAVSQGYGWWRADDQLRLAVGS